MFKNIVFLSVLFTFIFTFTTFAQNIDIKVDTSVVNIPQMDSTLINKQIFNILPSKANGSVVDVNIHQSQSIIDALKQYWGQKKEGVYGYRVRIYFDNKQNSRNISLSTQTLFNSMYPNIKAYRSYQNPFFKVTVGDYRTKSEALRLLKQIKHKFPAAFVVKEVINYPLF